MGVEVEVEVGSKFDSGFVLEEEEKKIISKPIKRVSGAIHKIFRPGFWCWLERSFWHLYLHTSITQAVDHGSGRRRGVACGD